MDDLLLDRLDTIINDFNDSKEVKDYLQYKDKVLSNKHILDLLDKLKSLDNRTGEYKSIKEELYSNEDFKTYKHLENELYYFSLEVSEKLSRLAR